MKQRVKVDSIFMIAVIAVSFLLFLFPQLYSSDQRLDQIFDFWGVVLILKGVYLRMMARAFKKNNSQQGGALVADGIYALTRNPMYLGTFTVGAGFVLIVWPWWGIFVFAFLFYNRFIIQVKKEEAWLLKNFGEAYKKYCKDVPRIFPGLKQLRRARIKNIVKPALLFTTKEKWGWLGWPVLGLVLATLQKSVVYGNNDFMTTLETFLGAFVFFALVETIKFYLWDRIFFGVIASEAKQS